MTAVGAGWRNSSGAVARRSAANAGSVMLTAELMRLDTDLYSLCDVIPVVIWHLFSMVVKRWY